MAGIQRRLSRCTPMDRPIKYDISRSQRLAPGPSASSSHFNIIQNTKAVRKEEYA
jgi:hypothetical protein